MGWYSNRVFPWIIDRVMANEVMTEQRRQILASAAGRVLEIGFGTGLNLPHYPTTIESLTVLDPNAGMQRRAAPRMAASPLRIESIRQKAEESLPLDANSFDTVVSTWTMCSIPNLPAALREIARVLRPGGQLLFIEHGLSKDPGVVRWQHRLNPIHKRIGDGCHLNRDIAGFVRGSELQITRCDEFYLPKTPRFAGWTYRGVAVKPSHFG